MRGGGWPVASMLTSPLCGLRGGPQHRCGDRPGSDVDHARRSVSIVCDHGSVVVPHASSRNTPAPRQTAAAGAWKKEHARIEVHQQQSVPLQPRLEADVPSGRRRPVPAREVTLTVRPAGRTQRIDILEPARHTVPQRTATAPAHRVHVRRLDARTRVIRPSRYSRPAPPAPSVARLGSLGQKPERLGSLRKRLDRMRQDMDVRRRGELRPQTFHETYEPVAVVWVTHSNFTFCHTVCLVPGGGKKWPSPAGHHSVRSWSMYELNSSKLSAGILQSMSPFVTWPLPV